MRRSRSPRAEGTTTSPSWPPASSGVGAVPGPTAWDAQVLNGVRAAVLELDRRGGVDEKVRLRLHVGTTGRLLRAGVRLLVLPCDARTQAASAAAARRREAFVLEPCNTGIWRRFPDVWPVSVSPADEARVLAGYIKDEGYERVAVLGEGRIARAVRAAVREEELVVAPVRRADVVAVAVGAPFAAATIARLRVRGVEVPIVATHGLDDRRAIRLDRAALEGVVFTTFGFAEPGSELDELAERYRALTGRRPDASVAALGYDAVRVLEFAMVEASSTVPDALAAAMRGLEVQGATGRIAYPERGGRNPEVSVALVQVENGQIVLLDRVDV